MVPATPSLCGIRTCSGSVSRSGVVLQCSLAKHHKAFLTRAKSGVLTWAFCTRGAPELAKKNLTVLLEEPKEELQREPVCEAQPIEDASLEAEPASGGVASHEEPDGDEIKTPQKQRGDQKPEEGTPVKRDAAYFGYGTERIRKRANFGGTPRTLIECAVCDIERDSSFRGTLGFAAGKAFSSSPLRRKCNQGDDQPKRSQI